jgi:hypothetical protein
MKQVGMRGSSDMEGSEPVTLALTAKQIEADDEIEERLRKELLSTFLDDSVTVVVAEQVQLDSPTRYLLTEYMYCRQVPLVSPSIVRFGIHAPVSNYLAWTLLLELEY